MSNQPILTHHDLWRNVAETLVERYRSLAQSAYLDSDVKGSTLEAAFREFMDDGHRNAHGPRYGPAPQS